MSILGPPQSARRTRTAFIGFPSALGAAAWAVDAALNLEWLSPLTGVTAGLFIAMAMAWRESSQEVERLKAEADQNSASFTGHVNRALFEDPTDDGCVAYLLVSIENNGRSASILHNWRLYVHVPGELERECRVPLPDGDCRLVTERSGNEVVIPRSEFISEKAYPTAVPQGAGCRGFLRATVPSGLPNGTRFILRFRDVHKRIYECELNTFDRTERGSDVRDIGNWPGVAIRHGKASATTA
jgi:hypothetical protein